MALEHRRLSRCTACGETYGDGEEDNGRSPCCLAGGDEEGCAPGCEACAEACPCGGRLVQVGEHPVLGPTYQCIDGLPDCLMRQTKAGRGGKG